MSIQDTRDRTTRRAYADAPTRPATIKAAAALAVLAAVATLANAVVALTDGKSLLHGMATDAVNQVTGGQSAGLDLGSLIDDAVNQEYGTLQARAYVGIVLALGYLALFRPIARGARKLRIVATLLAAVAVVMAAIDVRDQTPGLLHVFDVAELACAVLMVVALWLPSSNAYVASDKGRRSRG
ncbi:hypothetical protein [Catenulispora rubra]|uniref:hypothetical protein n=1 Tax=Catenulispora rubra TaxID=280293 RepID=UPI0018923481|nr:hypothetical protein [Catenulispora rubra]